MPFPIIETDRQYRDLRERIDALEQHVSAIDEVFALARAHKYLGRIEECDLRDLAPLDDARSDVAYTLQGLANAADEWEDASG